MPDKQNIESMEERVDLVKIIKDLVKKKNASLKMVFGLW
jgi:hypothetical protein